MLKNTGQRISLFKIVPQIRKIRSFSLALLLKSETLVEVARFHSGDLKEATQSCERQGRTLTFELDGEDQRSTFVFLKAN